MKKTKILELGRGLMIKIIQSKPHKKGIKSFKSQVTFRNNSYLIIIVLVIFVKLNLTINACIVYDMCNYLL